MLKTYAEPGVWRVGMKQVWTATGWIVLLTYLLVGVGAAKEIGPRPGADCRIAAGATPDGLCNRFLGASSKPVHRSRRPPVATTGQCDCRNSPINAGSPGKQLVPNSRTSLKKKLAALAALAGFADITAAPDVTGEDLLPPTSPAVDRTLSLLRSVVLLL